jgi:CRISPR-associated protein Cmr5
MNRQQQDLDRALKHVQEVSKEAREIYGGLCHTFPVLVCTNGLCQTLAFFHEKKSGGDGRAKAYQHMWQHIAETLGKQPDTLLNDVRAMNSVEYLRASRRLVEAWVYYKRFAVSILGVKAGEGDRD